MITALKKCIQFNCYIRIKENNNNNKIDKNIYNEIELIIKIIQSINVYIREQLQLLFIIINLSFIYYLSSNLSIKHKQYYYLQLSESKEGNAISPLSNSLAASTPFKTPSNTK